MTLKYENKKEFSGSYVKTTMLIFSDIKIDEQNCQLIKKIIKIYHGHSGEYIDFRILYDDVEVIYKIFVIIICFRTLLEDVSKREYSKFIQIHENNFMEYYNKVVPILVG